MILFSEELSIIKAQRQQTGPIYKLLMSLELFVSQSSSDAINNFSFLQSFMNTYQFPPFWINIELAKNLVYSDFLNKQQLWCLEWLSVLYSFMLVLFTHNFVFLLFLIRGQNIKTFLFFETLFPIDNAHKNVKKQGQKVHIYFAFVCKIGVIFAGNLILHNNSQSILSGMRRKGNQKST